MKRIQTADALRALAEAVAEKGEDYVYHEPITHDSDRDWDQPINPLADTCLYVYEGAPSCIVGHALHRLGVPLSAFEPFEGKEIDELINYVSWPIDDDAVEVFTEAQRRQDEGKPWGEALRAAEAVAR